MALSYMPDLTKRDTTSSASAPLAKNFYNKDNKMNVVKLSMLYLSNLWSVTDKYVCSNILNQIYLLTGRL